MLVYQVDTDIYVILTILQYVPSRYEHTPTGCAPATPVQEIVWNTCP